MSAMTVRSRAVERIPHRELRNNSAEILRRVAAGESFEITNHGQVVAILRRPAADDLWHAEMARPATKSRGWNSIKRVKAKRPMQDVLDELREDRL
ncbi:type II toxin-antitoxin system prevent-host-death family antitoxin [Nocardioides sp. LHD-245]|uniref:type II toxin-antitoxin system Phd/YefM family antitoxin n=1 Tax=Nocardioides sp. LHD-245 TaxID=3051387 RepID=UPI0027DF2908|nr:type II toxin-antitoxin system prevent-host-death family antitoxin [Nocardioides sp. LHD-245]